MEANFHLSLPCKDLEETKEFYLKILKTKIGRSSSNWIDVDLFGNQITFTQSGDFNFDYKDYRLGDQVLPSFHFGIIIDINDFGKIYGRLMQLDIGITIKTIFMKDSIGEHLSFFLKDPNDYIIEFKCFKKEDETFLK
jgi:extradiol dioxygenase family protein